METQAVKRIINAIERDCMRHGVYVELHEAPFNVRGYNGHYEISTGCWLDIETEPFLPLLQDKAASVAMYDHGEGMMSVTAKANKAQLEDILLAGGTSADLGH